ncbi:Ig-like domain-containing protein [Burkholderia sp. BCC1640]|nr:Ig-like domain-containing protein [Burkholderia sp. BCC1640]
MNHGTTDDTTPTLKGSAEPGAVVTIYDGGKAIGSTVANAAGGWSFTPGTPLADGEHDFKVTARDAAGNESGASESFNVTVDTSGPGATVITNVVDDVEPQTGSVSNGGFTNDTRPTLHGTAKPGSIVTIRDGDTTLGSATTDASGKWSFTPDSAHALTEGKHALTAQSKDLTGTMSDVSPSFVVNVDTTPPDAPVIVDVIDDFGDVTGSVHPGETTDDRRPTLHGTAEPGSNVLIIDRVNGTDVYVGRVQVGLDGHWSFRLDMQLENGPHSFQAKVTDAAGNSSAYSDAYDITVLQGVPSAPSITGVTDAVEPQVGNIEPNGATNDAQPTVKGTALPGQIVHVFIDGKEVGTTVTTATGQWSYRPTTPLRDGEHTFSATAEGADGQLSKPTGDYPIVVDTIAPSASTGEMLIDDVGPATGPIANGATTDDATPTYRGKAEAGAVVTIYDGEKAIGSTVVNMDGTWSFRPTGPLADGAHSLSTTVTDRAGNVSGHSKPLEFTVDTSHVVVTIDQVIDHVGSLQGPLQPGQTTDDRQPEVTGKAKPGSLVKVYVDGEVVGSVQAGGDGQWSLKLPAPLSEGAHEIAASSTTNGMESALTAPFELTVDVTAPDRPTIESAHDDVGAVQGTIVNHGTTDDTTPTLRGSAEPGAVVTIYDGGKAIGSTVANAAGGWSFTPSSPLSDGTHVFTVTARDAAGNTSQTSDGFTLHLDTSAPNPPVIMEVIDAVGDVTGPLSQHDTTDDAQPLVNGTAEKNSLVLIYDTVFGKHVLIGSARADASGNWSFRPVAPVAPLTDGDHHLTAVATDAAGNESAQSAGFDFTVLVGGVPTAPSISGVFDAIEPHVGNIGQSGVTNDPKATVTGTAQAGQIVHVFIDGDEVGSVKADATGRWWFRPDAPLADGEHKFTASAETEGGEKSAETGAYTIVVDTTAPAASTDQSLIDDVGALTGAITNGTVTDDATPTYGGKAEPGAIVTIYDGDKAIGSTVVDADGTWRYRPTEALADGKHSLSTTVTDAAGNASAHSASTEFTVDTSGAGVIVLETVTDHVGTLQGVLQPGQTTDDKQPEIAGRATANSLVKIYVNGALLASVTAGTDGKWSVKVGAELSAGLTDGTWNITATTTTPASGESKPTEPFTLTVDTTAPDVSTNETVTDHVGAVTGQVEAGGVTDDAAPVFSGKAEPGAVVTIFDGDKAIGSTVVDADGTWRYRPTEALADGKHSLSTTVTDAAGNTSAHSASTEFTVDTSGAGVIVLETVTDHVGTLQGVLQPGQTTDDKQPEIAGRATANSLVKIYANGALLASVTAGTDGKWSVKVGAELSAGLTDGTWNITATTTTPASGESKPTEPFTLTVDTTAPDVSTNETVTDHVGAVTGQVEAGGVTDDAAPVFSGKAEPGAIVTIFDGDKAIGSTVVDADGTWRYRPTESLADGKHSLSTTVTDAAGNTSERSPSIGFTVDTSHVEIAIDEVIDHVGTVTGALQPGQTTDDVHPEVTGKATPDSLVKVYVDGKVAGSVIAGADGAWSLRPNVALTEGVHRITATVTTPTTGESAHTAPFELEIDTTPPGVSTNETVTDHVGAVTGQVEAGGVTDDAAPVFSGKAEPGAIVTIYDGDKAIGSTVVDADGTWRYRPTESLADGKHSLSTTVTDAAGNTSAHSASTEFTVDTKGAGVSIAIDEVVDHVGTVTGALQPGQTTDDVHPEVTGKATPDSLVKVYVDGKVAGSVIAGADGAWSLKLETALTEGDHAITATMTTDASGESAQTAPFIFTVDLTPPAQPTIDAVTDDVGAQQGTIADGAYTDDKTPTLSGKAEANSIVTVYDGEAVLGSTIVAADGTWTYTPIERLTDGEHVFTVVARDAAGNASETSGTYTVHVDTVAPDGPKLEHLMDDVGPTTGDMFKVGLTDDSMPMFSGKAEPGSIVRLYSDYEGEKHLLGSARVTATGDWSIVPATDLDDGVHRITMTATDKAGNVGAPSDPYLLEVDTTAPVQPTITDVIVNVDGVTGSLGASGGTTTDHRPQIAGLAEAGATITVMTEHGGVLGTTHADATGHWTFMPDTALADGAYVISVTATDAAGNPSARSTKVTIEIEPSQAGSAYSNDVEASTDSLFGGEHDVASHAGGSPALHEGHDAANAGEVHEASFDVTPQEPRTVAANGVPAHGEHSVLAVDGGGQTLDLSTLLSPSLPGAIDAIDLSGSGANTLKLSLGDVLQHGGKDLFVDDGRTQLMVKGDAHDVVDLSGSLDGHGSEWVAHGETMVDGVAYAVYENSAQNAELLVQHGVTTHLM